MRGLLSPTSKANCENLSPSSSSHKLLYSPSLQDSCSSLNYSCMIQSQTKGSKFYSFKKIKEERIKQKNEQGRVIKQMVYKDNKPSRKIEKLKTLDDAKTIQSHNSPRSSISGGKRVIQQSIILMRGGDLENMVKQSPEDFVEQDSPKTPCFKRRNTFNEQIKIRSDFLKPISINPSLLRSIESGAIFHYQIVKMPITAYSRIMPINHQGLLQVYSVIALKSCVTHLSLVIYEPYTETLIQKLMKLEAVNFKQIISYMIQIVKILSHLKNICIYPQIEPTTVLLSNQNIKIKLRCDTQIQQTQRQALRECGYYFSSLIKNINGCCMTPSSTKRNKKITGLSIRKRLQFDNLMQEFIKSQDFTLDQAYLKLQAIDF